MTGCDLLSFLDVYSGYCQISMAREDKEKTSFTTLVGTYYYVYMPFEMDHAHPAMSKLTPMTLWSRPDSRKPSCGTYQKPSIAYAPPGSS